MTNDELAQAITRMSDQVLVKDPYHPTAPMLRVTAVRLDTNGCIVLEVRPNRKVRIPND